MVDKSPSQIITVSVQGIKGLCTLAAKCVKKDGHAGSCWPKS